MWNAKRQDLGTDIVVLPARRLVVFHPDLDYAEALGALMATLPDMHPDVAQRTVEKVTPRPRAEDPPLPRRSPYRALVAFVVAVLLGWSMVPSPAAAGKPDFGPDWQSVKTALGLTCWGDHPRTRLCRYEDSTNPFAVRGYRHETGDLYISSGPRGTVVFDFFDPADAEDYLVLHPGAQLHGASTVVW